MDERMHDITVHKGVLKAQLKAVDDDRNNVNKGASDTITLGVVTFCADYPLVLHAY